MAENKTEATSDTPKKSSSLVYIIILVLDLVVMGGAAFLVYQSTLGFKPPILTEEQAFEDYKKDGETPENLNLLYTLEKITTNLSGEPRRSVRVEVSLQMLDKDGFEEVMEINRKVEVRDRILRLLGGKTFAEVESLKGRLYLKDEIIDEINQTLVKGSVRDVYFGEFVIQ